ncbi:MAG: SCO family protein [Candidatus Kapabacteria bacterium]|nr:SCO family protein [Candidatus Kapabacteria bacterium]
MRLLAITTLLSILVGLTACQQEGAQQTFDKTPWDTLPVLRAVSSFSGRDQDSAVFRADAMKGRPWIASFFFTRCQTVCPALNNVLAGISREFSSKVSFVSLTSDPDNDLPSVMRAYGEQYGAKRSTWAFVTMPLDSMIRVSSSDLGLVSPSEPDLHSTRFVLIDSEMQVRGYYDSADPADVEKLRSVLKAIP